jgi:hypothetical protein
LFIQKAREIEADDGATASDKVLEHLTRQAPEPREKK